MPTTPKPPSVSSRGFIDSESGLLIPTTYRNRPLAREIVYGAIVDNAIDGRGFAKGMVLERDPDTLAVLWPEKGSGWDDVVNQAVVDGTIANVGLSPVIAPQISAMVRRQQNQALGASIDLTGRATPTTAARDALARFNDAPLGAVQALEKIVYGLCTYNRGAPIATVPITYSTDVWEEYGLIARPLQEERSGRGSAAKSAPTYYYLEVDWAKHGQPVPFLPSVFDLEPTGVPHWPYWYRTKVDGRISWVLLHETHILELTPGTSARPGIGTSPVWMCLGFLAEHVLVLEERAEKMLYSMTDGITLLGGVEGMSGAKIKEALKESRAEALTKGFVASKGHTILTSPTASAVSAVQISFRQPSNAQFKEWREHVEDIIAFCFGEPLSAMVIRGGVGYGSQAPQQSENTAEGGVAAMLARIGLALGTLYPRVQVSVSRPVDRAQRMNINLLAAFSSAVTPLVAQGVLGPNTVKAIIDRDILSLPVVAEDAVIDSPNANESRDPENQRTRTSDDRSRTTQPASGATNDRTNADA